MQTVPLFGAGVGGKSANVSAQGRVNCYVEHSAEPDKTPLAIYGRPGLTSYTPVSLSGGATTSGAIKTGVILGPVRGMDVHFVAGQTEPYAVYGVMGNVLFQQAADNVRYLQYANYLTSAPFSTSVGRVSLINDGINILVADGVGGYYAPSGTPAAMQPITDVDFPQTTPSVCTIASRAVCVDPAFVGRFRWSAVGDVTTWDALDYATAESSGDSLTAVFEANGELLLFGTQTLEFWGATGDTDVFRRIGSTGAQWGTNALDTIRKVGNRVMFLGRSQTGTRSVVLLEGYQPRPVSTPDIDADIEALDSPTATACVMTWQGHTFYVLNLMTKSWAYDLRDGTWSVWQTEGGRYAGEYTTEFDGRAFVSDYRTATLNYVSDTYADGSAVLTRDVVTRHTSNNMDRMTCWELVVDAETGVGLDTGQGVDPQIVLQVSKDGGHTWGNELWQSLGAVGNYRTRLVWRRLGAARDWVFRLRVTDPVKVVLLGGYASFD